MKKVAIGLIAFICIALAGCSTTYTLEGKSFSTAQAFLAETDRLTAESVKEVQPLPAPVTKKRLIFLTPSDNAILDIMKKYHAAQKGADPSGQALELYTNLAKSRAALMKVFADAAAKRNIYSSVRYVATENAVPNPQPSADEDVIFYTEPALNSGQFFFSSMKTGKQAFAYDRSQPGVTGKLRAFNEALQLQAIREQ